VEGKSETDYLGPTFDLRYLDASLFGFDIGKEVCVNDAGKSFGLFG